MGGKWPYTSCFVESCFQDLLKPPTASLFFLRVVRQVPCGAAIHEYRHGYSLEEFLFFHMVNILSRVVQAFPMRMNLPNPSAISTRSIFKLGLTCLNSEFSFFYTGCHTKVEDPSWLFYLLIAGGRIVEFTPFPDLNSGRRIQFCCTTNYLC